MRQAARAVPPRVLIVLGDQWPRALIRAALLEAGYDAVGARNLAEALSYPRDEAGRGPVELVVLDQHVLGAGAMPLCERLLKLHDGPPALLLGSAVEATPDGPWRRILRRPVSVGDIVAATRDMLPLPSAAPDRPE